MEKPPIAYCAVCSHILYQDEIVFMTLPVDDYQRWRPFYCSVVGDGDSTELVTKAMGREPAKEMLCEAPKEDDDLEEFLWTIPSIEDDKVRIVVCASHSSPTEETEQIHNFFRTQLDPGFAVEEAILPKLKWQEREFIAPMMVYTELRRPRYTHSLGVAPILSTMELSNKVVLYRSKGFSEYAGQRGMLIRTGPSGCGERVQTLRPRRRAIVEQWWDFLVENNPLFARYLAQLGRGADETAGEAGLPGMKDIEQVFKPADDPLAPQEPLEYFIPAENIGPYEVGSWTDWTAEVVGVDVIAEEEITRKNRNLFGLLFPWLYPYGRGYFSLAMARTKLRNRTSVEEQSWPIFSLKVFAKHTLSSIDRRFGLDQQFICFLYDSLLKERLYGASMRTTNPSVEGRPTAAGDVFGRCC